jgi:putative PEP-CTERM system TPR-repeat lipoprotein
LGQARLAMAERKLGRATELVDSVLARMPKDLDAWLFAGELHRLQANNDKAAAAYGQALKFHPGNFTAHLRRASVFAEAGKFDAAQADIDAARKISPAPIVDYTQALLFSHRGKPDSALEALHKVLSVAPDHMPSLLLAGLSHYSLNSLGQAEGYIRQFLDRSPDTLFARKLLVSILLKSNQGKRALETLQPALKTAQPDAQVLALAGEAYMQLRQFAKAAEYLHRAAAMMPTDATLHTKLGMTALALGDTDRAVAELESAAKLERGLSRADTLLIMTYLGNKDYGKALEAALTLEKKQPENPVTYNLLGGAYLGKNDLANARKSFERALTLKPDYIPAALMLARLDLEGKDADGARKRFNGVLAKDGKNVEAMIGRAGVERATGNSNEYAAWLEKARSASSTALEPRMLLARHYLQTNNANQARAAAIEAKNIQPRNPDVLHLLGEAQFASNDKAGAVTTYASLVGLVPQSPLAHYRLATAYMGNENYVAAADSLKKALKLKADYVDAKAALGLLEIRAQRYSEALKLAQQIQREAPKLPVGFTLEGDTLMGQQKYAVAEKAYEKALAVGKTPDLAMKLHVAASKAGRIQEANSRLLQWLHDRPEDTALRFYLADGYVKTREYRLAIQQYQLILQKDPKNILATNNLASVYRQEKDPRALDYFEKSYKLKPDSTTITHSLGWVLVEQGNVARGLELLRKASLQAPDNPEIRYHLAVALARSGEKAKARDELEGLLSGNKKFPEQDEARSLLKQLRK